MWGGMWVKILDCEGYKLTGAKGSNKEICRPVIGRLHHSRKAEETGSGKGQEIREVEWPYSQPRAHLRDGLL